MKDKIIFILLGFVLINLFFSFQNSLPQFKYFGKFFVVIFMIALIFRIIYIKFFK